MRDKTLTTAAGETISYSTLIVATGARVCFLPPEISNEKSDRVYYYVFFLCGLYRFISD